MPVEFPSVVEAVACAVVVQRGTVERNATTPETQRIEFRIGIHRGDIIVENHDIFGDGLNVAARLEGLEPSAICVSARVQEDRAGRLDVTFEDIGEQGLKNIARPVRVYCIRPCEESRDVSQLSARARERHPGRPRPSNR